MPPVLIPSQQHGRLIFLEGGSIMLTNESIVAILRVIPGFAEIVVRFFYDFAMHALSILGAM